MNGQQKQPPKAYQQTEQLLYNYYEFKKVIRERALGEDSIKETVHMVEMIEKGLDALSTDPYCKILEYLYFEGRTQEDVALDFKCSQVSISYHKKRLVQKLSIYLFPDQVVKDIMN